MKIRNLEPSDRQFLEKWHESSGFDYKLPDFTAKEFEVVRVLVDEDGQPVLAIATRKTAEAYLLLDSTWRNPRWRLEGFSQLHEDVCGQLRHMGFSDVHCWVPPEIDKSFGRRLVGLFRWVKSHWSSYSLRLTK